MHVETDQDLFLFSAPNPTVFDGFGHLLFQLKVEFSFSFFFRLAVNSV